MNWAIEFVRILGWPLAFVLPLDRFDIREPIDAAVACHIDTRSRRSQSARKTRSKSVSVERWPNHDQRTLATFDRTVLRKCVRVNRFVDRLAFHRLTLSERRPA